MTPFGTMPDGTPVESITLSGGGTAVTIITLGATVQAVTVPDRQGRVADVVLGYDDLAGYLAGSHYFGATIGRYANRIGGAAFTLDGKTYRTSANSGLHTLHGGADGFDSKVWRITAVTQGPVASVTLRLVSPNGDQGFPGALTVDTTFAVDGGGTLTQVIRATTDAPTVINLTNHSYWNLAGGGSAMDHLLTVPAADYAPVDATLIPTGEFRPVAATPFDFRRATAIGKRVRDGRDAQLRYSRGYDHAWAVSRTRSAEPRLVARLSDPGSGRTLEVLSTEPGVQVYSANFLDGATVGKLGRIYRMGDAVSLEPQCFPDTPNKPGFGSARLAPGELYDHHIAFRFTAE